MNKLLLILFIVPIYAVAQSVNQNYTQTTTFRKEGALNPVHQITYFDGLGRPIQKIANAQSNAGNDIITQIEYDVYGRQVKEYMPFANTSPSLNYHATAATDVATFYNKLEYEYTLNPYLEKQLENSPLNRVFKEAAPGNSWKMGSGHEVKFEYKTNASDEVKYFKARASYDATFQLFTTTIIESGNYEANRLYKTITKNENWISGKNNTTEEFKDKEGKIILKRTYTDIIDKDFNMVETQAKHDTYYVYDQFGNLTYVIPPLANGSIANLNGLDRKSVV